MNEFVSKKLGEVLAFSVVGAETLERASAALKGVFGDKFAELVGENRAHEEAIREAAAERAVGSVVAMKLEGTGAKLRSMRDLYLSDESDWANPAELMEWMGFFEGAAVVHWRLVAGAAEKLGDERLSLLASKAVLFHATLLDDVGAGLSNIGRLRA